MIASSPIPRLSSRRTSPSPPASPGRKRRSKSLWTSLDAVSDLKAAMEPFAESSRAAQRRAAMSTPRRLPVCQLVSIFSNSGAGGLVPPSFYPGQTIPSSLSLTISNQPPIPLSLNPTLVMSLVGRVEYPFLPPRTIVNISTPLEEGIRLWIRDAAKAAARRRRHAGLPAESTPELSLPQGKYQLPLSVQIPGEPGLAPTFDLDGASFKIIYEFQVVLSCDHPLNPKGAERVVLATSCSPFELLPATVPVRRASCPSMSVWVNGDENEQHGTVLHRKENSRWKVQPEIPTNSYSPSEMIPVTLTLTPPPLAPGAFPLSTKVIIRVSLHRREHCHYSRESLQDTSGRSGLVRETEVLSRWGWFETDGSCEVKIQELAMPLLAEGSWAHGYTTLLKIAKPYTVPAGEPVAVSSTFHLAITAGFSKSPLSPFKHSISIPRGQFSATLGPSHPDFLSASAFAKSVHCGLRTLPLGIVIGSVAEPALSPVLGTPGSVSDEDGWHVPPPGYEEALKSAPYEH